MAHVDALSTRHVYRPRLRAPAAAAAAHRRRLLPLLPLHQPQVKKKFIDKKQATTYNLVFRSTEDADDVPDGLLVDAEKRLGYGRVDGDATAAAAAANEAAGIARPRYPPGHPLAWLQEEAQQAPISEERRRELIELGFPGGWRSGVVGVVGS